MHGTTSADQLGPQLQQHRARLGGRASFAAFRICACIEDSALTAPNPLRRAIVAEL
jgi:hypothetical protein